MEAGAQGEHKIQRGYLPETTYSCHYILDDEFRKAIGDFLVREKDQVYHQHPLNPSAVKYLCFLTCTGLFVKF